MMEKIDIVKDTEAIVFKDGPKDGEFLEIKRGTQSIHIAFPDGREFIYYRSNIKNAGKVVYQQ